MPPLQDPRLHGDDLNYPALSTDAGFFSSGKADETRVAGSVA